MRYLVLSDIHANLEALEAVLASAAPYDQVLLLGDYVGYGADPNAVIDRMRRLPVAALIRGNHDKVAAGLEDTEGFNHVAREAITWTASVLTPENRAWLAALPAGPAVVDGLTEICHGTTFDEDAYVFDDLEALRSLRSAERPLCLYGHTHVPAIYRLVGEEGPNGSPHGGRTLELLGPPRGVTFPLTLDGTSQYLVNCGAVGQPRDGDARAAYGMLDTDARRLVIHRTSYDLAAAQQKIVEAGLPEVLAQRLAMGR
ncbi:MAG: metallophosphoesterase family protein [Acidobacteria bacterium]|nr:metallophosphoesterase family protein [Acidobacteriota bacterium]